MRHVMTWENVPFKPQLSLELIEGDESVTRIRLRVKPHSVVPLRLVRGEGGLTIITLCPLVASAPSSSAVPAQAPSSKSPT